MNEQTARHKRPAAASISRSLAAHYKIANKKEAHEAPLLIRSATGSITLFLLRWPFLPSI